MYKLSALREDRRFLRDYKRVPEDAEAFDATTDSNPGSFALEQLGSTGTSPYEYRPLERSRPEIRLLTLEPGSGNSMLRCTLKHDSLDAMPPPLYETISYVCGDPAHKSTILLHGHEVQAMATSEAALRRMRLQDKPRTLWIDSICIDQDKIDERGHQVGMMYKIYSITSRNLVWLGPYDNTLAEYIAAMEEILQEIAKETQCYEDFKKMLFNDQNGTFLFSKRPLSNMVDCLAFLRLVGNPWFSRLWIVQEPSLAPSSMCHYGEFEVALTSILRSARWLYHKGYQMPDIPLSTLLCLENAVSIFSIADKEYGALHTFGGSTMASLLSVRDFGKLQTFERRDRVFAILGLWQMLTKATALPDVLRPDYSLSVVDVFKIAIRYAIDECGDLGPLEWISEPSREARVDSWPSWVPVIDRYRTGEDEPCPISGLFTVDNNAPMLVIGNNSQRRNDLIVCGILFDRITEVTPAIDLGTIDSDIRTLLADLERPRAGSSVETSTACLQTQISLVLLAGLVRWSRVAHQEALQGYRDFKAYLERHGAPTCTLWDLEFSASDEDRSASEYCHEAYARTRHRAIFHTATGHVGLGPRCAQPGDVVAILYGGRLPMVMRPLPELPKDS
jgi:hypothetical protein